MASRPNDVKLIPAYRLAAAARLIDASPTTLRSWFHGREYKAGGHVKRTLPVLPVSSKPGAPISFIDLAEAHVFQSVRKAYKIPFKNIKRAADYLAEIKGRSLTILAHKDFYIDGANLLLEIEGRLVSLSERGQHVDRELIKFGLKQLNYGKDGFAEEFYPRYGETYQNAFFVNPTVNFGRLSIARLGVGADVIARRFTAGEKLDDIATDYAATRDEVEDALRWHERLSA